MVGVWCVGRPGDVRGVGGNVCFVVGERPAEKEGISF